jgi:moderate conductance mechanosensitive channel
MMKFSMFFASRFKTPNWCVCVAIVLSVLFLGFASEPTFAAGAKALAKDAFVSNSEGKVARLSDSDVRRLLLEKLGKEESEPKQGFNPAITAWELQRSFGTVQKKVSAILATFPELPGVFPRAFKILSQDRGKEGIGTFVMVFLVALAFGAAAEFLLRRELAARRSEASKRHVKSLRERASSLGFLFILDLIAIAAFLAVTVIVYFIMAEGDGWFRTTFVFYMLAVTIIRVVIAAAAVFLAQNNPNLRIPQFSDNEASRIAGVVLATVILGAFGFFTCALFGMLGIRGDVHLLMLNIVGTATSLGLISAVICGRHALAHDLSLNTENKNKFGGFVSTAWPWFFAVLIAFIWVGIVISAFLDHTPLYGAALFTIALLFIAPSVLAGLEREARVLIDAGEEVWPAIYRALRIGLAALFIVLLAVAWRIDLLGMTGQGIGGQVANALLQVTITVLVTYILWQVARIWIDRKIAIEDEEAKALGNDASEMEIGGAGLSRIRTLLPLFKRTIQITLGLISFIIVLSALGVNIGPVLAGAGVVGLAVGFGSQALVRDIVSGVFFLLDDAFRLGEYVNVGSVRGSVEKISLRSFQLRHHRGSLNTVPFGEIKTLENYSRDWSIMKLRFRITFGTDIEKVRKIFKKIGKELLTHPDVGEDFIQPLKSQGVLEVDDYGLIVRAKFMCKPGRQFIIRRYAYMAVQKAFEENGIEFARPEIKVVTEKDDDDREGNIAEGAAVAVHRATQAGTTTKSDTP